ncbi:hypothetical protein [Virgibacillus ihumii]|uniref:hypothetical protein n=1 Tax=Virgibacillus ihumii TaxID=2686091 RepID=UPI00157D4584|nr:hypothetical protein [Virgibacillus ihumii]
MYYDNPLVKKEAKKHKRFLESFTINPGSFLINNNQYFFVNYYRGKKMTDCAVVSPTSKAEKSEYLMAYDALMEYAQLTVSIMSFGAEKATADMHAFTTLQQFFTDVLNNGENYLKQEDKKEIAYCLERINLILDLQDRLGKIYEEFYQKTKKFHEGFIENFTNSDIEEAVNYMGEIDYIQYKQLVANYESIPKFKYIKELEIPELKKYKTNAVRSYLEEFSINQGRQRKRIDSLKFQTDMETLTKEEHIEGAIKDFYRNLAETNASSRKRMRYPK